MKYNHFCISVFVHSQNENPTPTNPFSCLFSAFSRCYAPRLNWSHLLILPSLPGLLKVISSEEEGHYLKWQWGTLNGKKNLNFGWFRNAQLFNVILLYCAWVPAAINLKTRENIQTPTFSCKSIGVYWNNIFRRSKSWSLALSIRKWEQSCSALILLHCICLMLYSIVTDFFQSTLINFCSNWVETPYKLLSHISEWNYFKARVRSGLSRYLI